MAAAADVPLLITSENSSSERRVTPAWTIAHLKGRLEPITGIPAGCQKLQLKIASQAPQPIEAADEDATQVYQWPLQPYAEIHVGEDFSVFPYLRSENECKTSKQTAVRPSRRCHDWASHRCDQSAFDAAKQAINDHFHPNPTCTKDIVHIA